MRRLTQLVPLGAFLLSSMDTASTGEARSQLDLSPGFPRTIFCRSERALAGMSAAEVAARIGRFDAVSLKLFNEAPRQRYRDLISAIRQLKRHRPRMPVLVHVDHFAHVREREGSRLSPGREFWQYELEGMFPGHWLYYPGSTVGRAIGQGDTEIRVADASKFAAADNVRLWPAEALGEPRLWHDSEVLFAERVDRAAGRLHVKRGRYGTRPRAFAAEARATPHGTMKPRVPDYNLDDVGDWGYADGRS